MESCRDSFLLDILNLSVAVRGSFLGDKATSDRDSHIGRRLERFLLYFHFKLEKVHRKIKTVF